MSFVAFAGEVGYDFGRCGGTSQGSCVIDAPLLWRSCIIKWVVSESIKIHFRPLVPGGEQKKKMEEEGSGYRRFDANVAKY